MKNRKLIDRAGPSTCCAAGWMHSWMHKTGGPTAPTSIQVSRPSLALGTASEHCRRFQSGKVRLAAGSGRGHWPLQAPQRARPAPQHEDSACSATAARLAAYFTRGRSAHTPSLLTTTCRGKNRHVFTIRRDLSKTLNFSKLKMNIQRSAKLRESLCRCRQNRQCELRNPPSPGVALNR